MRTIAVQKLTALMLQLVEWINLVGFIDYERVNE
jgi:hypothetical protein